MKLTKAERKYLKKIKKGMEDEELVGGRLVTKIEPRKKRTRKKKEKSAFININVSTVKAKKTRKKKIKMPAKSLKISPKKKPQSSWLYKYWMK